jgi:hypothetical protein
MFISREITLSAIRLYTISLCTLSMFSCVFCSPQGIGFLDRIYRFKIKILKIKILFDWLIDLQLIQHEHKNNYTTRQKVNNREELNPHIELMLYPQIELYHPPPPPPKKSMYIELSSVAATMGSKRINISVKVNSRSDTSNCSLSSNYSLDCRKYILNNNVFMAYTDNFHFNVIMLSS